MFKIYGVTEDKKTPQKSTHDTHHGSHTSHTDNHTLTHTSHSIDVAIHDEHDSETDIWQIAVDILDTSSSIIIVAPIAGVDPADIDIWLSRNILTLSGNRRESPIYLDARRMLVEECFYGAFSRSIILPENLGFDEIRATVEHNVIIVTIPKLTLISKSIKIDA
jgi:HSP20 family molecular chaperone IbpA